MNWDDVRIFKTVAENGSIRKSATDLNLSHSTLSRRISALEKKLCTKLFFRLQTGLALTNSGAELLNACLPLSMEFESIERHFVGRDHSISGEIKVTLPDLLATHLLFTDMIEFQELWPQISLQIETTNNILDLHSGEADIAIRLTNKPEDSLVGRSVCELYQAAYASREYVEELTLNNVSAVNWVKPKSATKTKEICFGDSAHTKDNCDLVVNHIELQLQAAEKHRGVALLPCFMADGKNNLVKISQPYRHFGVWILCSPELRLNKRMQLFRQFMLERLLSHAPLLEGKTTQVYRTNSKLSVYI